MRSGWKESALFDLGDLSLTPRFSKVLRDHILFQPLRLSSAHDTSLKRGVKENGHSDVADSFCAGCLTGADRVAAARRAAFLRRRYATRRLRLTRTRCCCPMESLSIENRRNAIGIEINRVFLNDAIVVLTFPCEEKRDLSATRH